MRIGWGMFGKLRAVARERFAETKVEKQQSEVNHAVGVAEDRKVDGGQLGIECIKKKDRGSFVARI